MLSLTSFDSSSATFIQRILYKKSSPALLVVNQTLREKCPKYGVFSGPYFHAFGLNTEISVFSPNAGKYGPEKTSDLETFHTVKPTLKCKIVLLYNFRGCSFS